MKRLYALVTTAAALAGCSLGQPTPEGSEFLLHAGTNVGSAERGTGVGSAERERGHGRAVVQAAKVVPPYSDRRFIYRTGPSAYSADPYNGFLAPPSAMLSDVTIQWLQINGPFETVFGEGVVLDADYRIQQIGEVLCAEFLPGKAQAVVQIHYFVTDERSSPPKIVLDCEYEGTAPLADGNPATIAAGLNVAFAQVLRLMTADLRVATAPR
ncbi:MAG: hypothetical protein SGJ09_12345 [Phycisphaerae bacterium]|nr:hypothetical protein [Phycisphaerae bacterium]